MVYVMGLDDAKSRYPTPAEEPRICWLLHEAMSADGGGESVQCLVPSGPASVPHNYDGSPMVTDIVSHDTCKALTQVLAGRNEDFIQIVLVGDDGQHDFREHEELASISGRPVLYNAGVFNDR